MIKAVLFDVGNVIVRWERENLFDTLIADPERRAFFLNEVCTMDWHTRHDAGARFAENRVELLEKYPEFIPEIMAFDERFADMLDGAIAETEAVIDELQARGVPMYALTNMPEEKAALVFSQSHVFSYFKDMVVSAHERLIKPDPAIFALALKRMGLTGPEVFFIDDNAANIAVAQAMGFHTHRFDDPKALRPALVTAGVL